MTKLFESPGMTAMTVLILCIHVASFLLLGMLLLEYRHIHRKRMQLLQALGTSGCRCVHALWERRLAMATYAFLTLAIFVASFSFYVFQPHFF